MFDGRYIEIDEMNSSKGDVLVTPHCMLFDRKALEQDFLVISQCEAQQYCINLLWCTAIN